MKLGRGTNHAGFISAYAFAHFAMDAACSFLLIGVLDLGGHIVISLVIYNACAFVLQAPFGYLIDKTLNPKMAAILGLTLAAVSFVFWNNVLVALLVAGTGNALFHVGGGSLTLSIKNKTETMIGIFVAPGGIGLAFGAFWATSQKNLMLFPLALILLAFLLYFIQTPVFERKQAVRGTSYFRLLIAVIILIPIAVRSLTGLSVEFPWKENQPLFVLLVSSIAVGKAFGGILADRFGLLKVGLGGFFLAAPLLAFFASIPALGIMGALLLNLTMPVTLIAIVKLMPYQKGLSFGLTTSALFIGALPIIIGKDGWVKSEGILFLFIFAASLLLSVSFYLSNKYMKG